jgi:predicted dehydrogenase
MAHDSGNWGVDTTFSGLLEFAGGAVGRVGASMEQPRRCELWAYGTKGRLHVPDMFNDSGPINVRVGDEERTQAVPAPDRFKVQIDEFSECVLTRKAPEFPAEDGLRNMAAIVALLDAARRGATVAVEKI